MTISSSGPATLVSGNDLDGRRLAFHSHGAVGTALAVTWLQSYPGVKPETLVLPGSSARAAALLAGVIDATVLERADAAEVERRCPGCFNVLADFLAAYPGLKTSGVHVRARFLAERPDCARRYVAARVTANRRVAVDRQLLVSEALARPHLSGLAEEISEAELEILWHPDGGLTRENVRFTVDFFVSAGRLPASVTAAELADLRVLEEALALLATDASSPEPAR
jgi:ABC-type nitrate/sulfonate/bicarbonate transport system substrate-binding protein